MFFPSMWFSLLVISKAFSCYLRVEILYLMLSCKGSSCCYSLTWNKEHESGKLWIILKLRSLYSTNGISSFQISTVWWLFHHQHTYSASKVLFNGWRIDIWNRITNQPCLSWNCWIWCWKVNQTNTIWGRIFRYCGDPIYIVL